MSDKDKEKVSQAELDVYNRRLNSSIKQAQAQLRTAEKLYRDYTQVHTLLGELPKQLKHKVMVPFGPLAFMPGEITHTNEFTVLLGENWFVERSATQAQAIMARRQGYLQEQMASLKLDLLKLGQTVEVTNEAFGVRELEVGEDGTKIVEIKEEYVPEPENLKVSSEAKVSYPLRQKTPQELEEDQAILDAINKIYEDEQNGLLDEEESEDDKCKYQASDQEDEDERYREGLSYTGGIQSDSDHSQSDEDEPVLTSQKKQVRFSDSVLEPSSRDPSEFRSNPLWKMLQATTLDCPSETTRKASLPIRKVTPADLPTKKPSQNAAQARPSVMSETVVENENIGPVDVDELEMAIDMQVIAEEYQRRKQDIIRSTGGYALTPHEQDLKAYTKYMFDAPAEKECSQESPKPRKMSRFKAARLEGSQGADDDL